MKFKAFAWAAAVVLLGTASVAATQNWVATVALNDGGHTIGNPAAKILLTEYVSYTCPHCAHFTRDGEQALKLAYVAPGKIKLEVRHLLRDPVDLTAALLTNCGAPAKFPANHTAIMLAQDTWLPKMVAASRAQSQRWTTGTPAARRKAMASDLGFYQIMERRGYSRTQADRCLSDEIVAKQMADISARDWKLPGIGGTPSFAIDGMVLAGTHTWPELQSQLDARF